MEGECGMSEHRAGDRDRVPSFVDAERLCFELSISADTLERWVHAGVIPPPKVGAPKIKRAGKRRTTRAGAPSEPIRVRGVKRLWDWQQVRDWIDGRGRSAPVSRDLGQEIEDYARAATQGPSHR